MRYFFDDERETLHFTALAFPSANRGIAAGVIVDEQSKHKPRNVAVITADGGNTWSQVQLQDQPVSLYFLDDSVGWMVAREGIWKTEESGRTWKKLSGNPGSRLLKLWFLDAKHGFAVGLGGAEGFIWTATGGSIPRGPSGTAVYTAGGVAGTFSLTATSADDPTQFLTVPVIVRPAGALFSGHISQTRLTSPAIVRGEFDVTLTLSAAGQLSVTAASGTLFASQMESTPCIEPDNTLGSALTGVTFEGTVTSGVWSPALDTLTLRGSLRKHFVFLANGDSCEIGSSDDPGLEDEDIFSRPASRMIVNGVLVGLDFADAAGEVTGQVLRQP